MRCNNMLSSRKDHELYITPMTAEGVTSTQAQCHRRNSQQSSGYSSLENCVISSEPFLMHYMLGKVIGKGNFSVVKKAEHLPTSMQVAVKIVDKSKLSTHDLGRVSREVNIMKHLRHPHITKMYQVVETTSHLYMVMEYVPCGELFDYVQKKGRFSEPVARQKFVQLLDAVDYCHKQGVVHRDLKMENVLLDAQLNVKLADFGFGTYNKADSLLQTFCGSPPYAAPEIFQGVPYKGIKSDIWSLGVILFCMVVGGMPFEQECLPSLRMQVLSGKFRVPYWVPLACENLMRSMLRVQPERRATISQIRAHPWITNAEDNQSSHKNLKGLTPSSSSESGSMPFSWHPEALEIMARYGHSRQHIAELLHRKVYDHVMAHYLLLCDYLSSSHVSSSTSTAIHSVKSATSTSTGAYCNSSTYSLPSTPALCITSASAPSAHVTVTTDSGTASHMIHSPHHRLITEHISDEMTRLHLANGAMMQQGHSPATRQQSPLVSLSHHKENGPAGHVPLVATPTSPTTMYVPTTRLRHQNANVTTFHAAPTYTIYPHCVPPTTLSTINGTADQVNTQTCNAVQNLTVPSNSAFAGCNMTPYSQRRMSLAYTHEPILSMPSKLPERPPHMLFTVLQHGDVSGSSPSARDGQAPVHKQQLSPFSCLPPDNSQPSTPSSQPVTMATACEARPPILNLQAMPMRRASDVAGASPSHNASGYGMIRIVPTSHVMSQQQPQSYQTHLQRIDGVWELTSNGVNGCHHRAQPAPIPEHKVVDNRHVMLLSTNGPMTPLVAPTLLTSSLYDESTTS